MKGKKKFLIFLKLIEKKYILFLLYLFGLFASIYIWSYFISIENSHVTDEIGKKVSLKLICLIWTFTIR